MSGLDTANPVVVTGMHRSGTSLLASMLARSGVNLGPRLLGATDANPRGHFEDLDLLAWHDHVLADHGLTWYEAGTGCRLDVSNARRREAEDLLAIRNKGGAWGWKNPRTCLLLEFWGERLPNATFVFIFRNPGSVLDSLRRRQDPEFVRRFRGAWALKQLGFDPFRSSKALDLWMHSNECIIRFAERNPERCRVIELSRLEEQWPALFEYLRGERGLALQDVAPGSIIEPDLLNTSEPHAATPIRHRQRIHGILKALRGLSGSS